MKNISKKGKFNIDAIAEVKKDKNFQRDSEGISVRIKLAVGIFNAREAMGLSQQKLAKEIGSTQREISRLENGDVNLKIELLNRITKKLGFTSNNFAEIFGCPSLVRIIGGRSETSNTNVQISNEEVIYKAEFKTNTNTINK
jgi:transcriptional regulator with XRE-family HTH domain